jgi:hypothetical protein
MSQRTHHNEYNRARQRAHEAAEYKRQNRAAREKAELNQRLERLERARKRRGKGRLEMCGKCKKFFVPSSAEISPFVCPSCVRANKAKELRRKFSGFGCW